MSLSPCLPVYWLMSGTDYDFWMCPNKKMSHTIASCISWPPHWTLQHYYITCHLVETRSVPWDMARSLVYLMQLTLACVNCIFKLIHLPHLLLSLFVHVSSCFLVAIYSYFLVWTLPKIRIRLKAALGIHKPGRLVNSKCHFASDLCAFLHIDTQ